MAHNGTSTADINLGESERAQAHCPLPKTGMAQNGTSTADITGGETADLSTRPLAWRCNLES